MTELIRLSLDSIMRELERNLTFSMTVPTDHTMIKDFRRNLSQRKIRMGIAGRLVFSVEDTNAGTTIISIALVPGQSKEKKTRKGKEIAIKNVNLGKML